MPIARRCWIVWVVAIGPGAIAAFGQASAPAPPDPVAPLVVSAEAAFRSGRPDEAIAGYDRAAAAARERGEADRAFDLAYLAAAIEHQRGAHAEALRRFRAAALAWPEHSKSPEAHRLAAYHAAQLAQTREGDAINRYGELLEEYLAKWPGSTDVNRVRRQLGQLRAGQQNWAAAVAAYRATASEDAEFRLSIDGAAACYRAWIEQLRAEGKPIEPVASESLVVGPGGRMPEIWVPVQRQAAREAARLWLETAGNRARGEALLRGVLAGSRDSDADGQATAQLLLVAACASQGRRSEAAAELARIPAAPGRELFALLERLQRLAEGVPADARRELGELELRVLELLEAHAAALDAATRRSLGRLAARALADVGRVGQALEAQEALVQAFPRDGQIQEDYARLLGEQSDASSLGAARSRWLEILGRSEPGSPRWFRAEYAVAELDYRLGDVDRARQIIRRLEVLYPSMGGGELKARFVELGRRLDQGR
jgi:tetratricopeptide (TPR) repeat protein